MPARPSCLHLSDVRGRANTSVRPRSLHPPAPGNSAPARPETIRLLVLAGRWQDEAGSKKLVGKKAERSKADGYKDQQGAQHAPPLLSHYIHSLPRGVFLPLQGKETYYLKPENNLKPQQIISPILNFPNNLTSECCGANLKKLYFNCKEDRALRREANKLEIRSKWTRQKKITLTLNEQLFGGSLWIYTRIKSRLRSRSL